MAVPSGKAAYKKKDGIIALSSDQRLVTWSPLPGTGPPVVSLATANITNLQQTPDSSTKVMLKIFSKPPSGEGEPVAYLFHFNSADPRPEANALKDALSRILVRSEPGAPPKPATPGPAAPAAASTPVINGTGAAPSASASMTFASTVNAPGPASTRWFDDNILRADIELQQSLMKKDRTLHQTYMDALSTKPDSISNGVFNSQFWSTRTSLLRAHAIETNQKHGAYNVLSIVKPRTVDGELKLSMSVEQIQMIFEQHPLIKRIYNENVPKLSEDQFWSRFFLSKLSKKLRGERVSEMDNPDPLFDRYDAAEDTRDFVSRVTAYQQIPNIIDVEGNEENQGGFRSGNRKDIEMRPRTNVPIVRTLNSLSEKILSNVAPADHDPTSASSGMDDETYRELYLRDLQGDVEAARVVLNVKEQTRFFANQTSSSDAAVSADAKMYAQQEPADVLFEVQADLETLEDDGAGGLDLHKGIGVDDESDSDDGAGGDEGPSKTAAAAAAADHVGSRSCRKTAQSRILSGMRKKRFETYGLDDGDEAAAPPMGIAPDMAHKCYVTNATTTEFLRQFWSAFLSGNPDRAQELAYHVESLRNSMARIEALAEDAERYRDKVVEQRKREILEHYQKTKKKIRNWKPEMVRGGRREVLALFGPTVESLGHAQRLYRGALEAEGVRASTEGG